MSVLYWRSPGSYTLNIQSKYTTLFLVQTWTKLKSSLYYTLDLNRVQVHSVRQSLVLLNISRLAVIPYTCTVIVLARFTAAQNTKTNSTYNRIMALRQALKWPKVETSRTKIKLPPKVLTKNRNTCFSFSCLKLMDVLHQFKWWRLLHVKCPVWWFIVNEFKQYNGKWVHYVMLSVCER